MNNSTGTFSSPTNAQQHWAINRSRPAAFFRRADLASASVARNQQDTAITWEGCTGEDKIPVFDGNILHLDDFLATFYAHINPSLSETAQYAILKSKLTTFTRRVLATSELAIFRSTAPCTEAVTRLLEFFRKPNVLVNCLRFAVSYRVPVIRESYSNAHWQVVIEYAQQVAAKLRMLEEDAENDGGKFEIEFGLRFAEKLSYRDRRNFQYFSAHQITLSAFIVYATYRQTVNIATGAVPPKHGPSTKPCPLCAEEYHSPIDCDIYRSIHAKRECIFRRSLCYRCLRPFRPPHFCNMKCAHCEGRHHAAICTLVVEEKEKITVKEFEDNPLPVVYIIQKGSTPQINRDPCDNSRNTEAAAGPVLIQASPVKPEAMEPPQAIEIFQAGPDRNAQRSNRLKRRLCRGYIVLMLILLLVIAILFFLSQGIMLLQYYFLSGVKQLPVDGTVRAAVQIGGDSTSAPPTSLPTTTSTSASTEMITKEEVEEPFSDDGCNNRFKQSLCEHCPDFPDLPSTFTSTDIEECKESCHSSEMYRVCLMYLVKSGNALEIFLAAFNTSTAGTWTP